MTQQQPKAHLLSGNNNNHNNNNNNNSSNMSPAHFDRVAPPVSSPNGPLLPSYAGDRYHHSHHPSPHHNHHAPHHPTHPPHHTHHSHHHNHHHHHPPPPPSHHHHHFNGTHHHNGNHHQHQHHHLHHGPPPSPSSYQHYEPPYHHHHHHNNHYGNNSNNSYHARHHNGHHHSQQGPNAPPHTPPPPPLQSSSSSSSSSSTSHHHRSSLLNDTHHHNYNGTSSSKNHYNNDSPHHPHYANGGGNNNNGHYMNAHHYHSHHHHHHQPSYHSSHHSHPNHPNHQGRPTPMHNNSSHANGNGNGNGHSNGASSKSEHLKLSATSTPTLPAGVTPDNAPPPPMTHPHHTKLEKVTETIMDRRGNGTLGPREPLRLKPLPLPQLSQQLHPLQPLQQHPQQVQPPQMKKVKSFKFEDLAVDEYSDDESYDIMDDGNGSDQNDGDSKVKRSRHMPLACPFHYLSHTRCDTKTCATRKLYHKNTSPLHDYQYRALKTLYSNHKPNRTFFMKQVKMLFRQFAPDGQRAFDELLKELKQQRIVNQSEIDQCIQQEQEQLQHKKRSPKSSSKKRSLSGRMTPTSPLFTGIPSSPSHSAVTATACSNLEPSPPLTPQPALPNPIQSVSRVKKPKTLNGNVSSRDTPRDTGNVPVGSKRKMDQLSLLAQQQQLILQQLENNDNRESKLVLDGLDFDPALLADYGRTYNTRNRKKRKVEDTVDETSGSESDSEFEDEKHTGIDQRGSGDSATVMIKTPAPGELQSHSMIHQEPTLTPSSAGSKGKLNEQDTPSFMASTPVDTHIQHQQMMSASPPGSLSGTASESTMSTVYAPISSSISSDSVNYESVNSTKTPAKSASQKECTPNDGMMWYEYDADKCDHQVLVQCQNGDWIVQENGAHKYVDMEDEDSDSESEDDNDMFFVDYVSETVYRSETRHYYSHPCPFPESKSTRQQQHHFTQSMSLEREEDIAKLLVVLKEPAK